MPIMGMSSLTRTLSQSLCWVVRPSKSYDKCFFDWCTTCRDGVDADRDFVCLTSHLDDSAMGRPCKNYLMNFKKLTRGDVNMRPRVVRTCSKDMGRLCTDAGLDVVTCLVDNVEDIHSPDCKELIQEEIELEVSDCCDCT